MRLIKTEFVVQRQGQDGRGREHEDEVALTSPSGSGPEGHHQAGRHREDVGERHPTVEHRSDELVPTASPDARAVWDDSPGRPAVLTEGLQPIGPVHAGPPHMRRTNEPFPGICSDQGTAPWSTDRCQLPVAFRTASANLIPPAVGVAPLCDVAPDAGAPRF